MARVSVLINDQVVEVAKTELKKLGKFTYVAKKLQAVISAKEHGITEVAKIYDISRTTLTAWIKHVKNLALDKLQAPPERKRKSKINDEHKQKIREWIANNPSITIQELKIKIEKAFDIIVGKSTVHRVIKSMSYSYITPRPRHYKQNKELVVTF